MLSTRKGDGKEGRVHGGRKAVDRCSSRLRIPRHMLMQNTTPMTSLSQTQTQTRSLALVISLRPASALACKRQTAGVHPTGSRLEGDSCRSLCVAASVQKGSVQELECTRGSRSSAFLPPLLLLILDWQQQRRQDFDRKGATRLRLQGLLDTQSALLFGSTHSLQRLSTHTPVGSSIS